MRKGTHPKLGFEGDKATNEWLDSRKPSTRNSYASQWKEFLEFCGMTGDQILADRKNDTEGRWEKKLLPFKNSILQRGKSDYHARQGTIAVRSFFHYHRTKLGMTPQESGQLRQARRKTEDYRFSRDDLKKTADFADIEEQYVIVAGKSFGLRAGDFLRLTRGHFDALHMDEKTPIFVGEYATQKEGVSAFPFIDSDAHPIIKNMLEKMTREGRTEPSERMVLFTNESSLSDVVKRVADKAGIPYGNKRVRFHCLRKFLIDNLSRFMSESKWKQIVGKKITESAYVSPDSLKEDYARAMTETTFTKSVTEGDMKVFLKKEMYIALAKSQGATDEEIKAIFRSEKLITDAEQIERLEQLMKELAKGKTETKTQTNCSNGRHCQRITEENALPELLANGWHVVAVLSSGRVVVSNEA